MTSRELDEYKALRATIRQRGTARIWLFIVGMGMWSAVVLATVSLMAIPLATLFPLLLLAAVFEALFALHTGIERIGRYLQVFHEPEPEGTAAQWEHAAMAPRRDGRGGPIDPLFSLIFWLAAVLNFLPAILAGAVQAEWSVIGVVHAAFMVRVGIARRYAQRQRAVDLAHFRELKKHDLTGR